MTQQGNEAVYEMMWDCKYCGQKKLLGLTHRFCAGCGAPQDPSARYFPPENEKVAVKDHPFVGADVACPACKQPMGRAAKCCTNCGSPIDKGAEVARKADVVIPPPTPIGPQAPAPGKSNTGLILGIIGGVLGLILIIGLVMAFWKREGVFVVTGKTWERAIEVQRFDTVRKTAWRSDAPAGGRELSCRKEKKGTEKVKDGETCGTRKKDMGNGTYKEVKECTPKYREEPVMADRCEYEVTEWKKVRAAEAKGTEGEPRWPDASLSRPGTCLGCEREGPRTETYTVQFVDEKSKKDASCDLPQAKWATFAKGTKWKGKVRVATGGLDCDGLVRP